MVNLIGFNPKFIRVFSDLHLNLFDIPWKIPSLPSDPDTLLILAGDIAPFLDIKDSESNLSLFMESIANQFTQIAYVPGNHEITHYNPKLFNHVRSLLKTRNIDNITILDNDIAQYGDTITLVGSTLWPDFNHGDADTLEIFKDNPISSTRITLEEVLELNEGSKLFIEDAVERFKSDEHKTRLNALVTHYAPSQRFINPFYAKDPEQKHLNGTRASALENLISEKVFNLYVFGHTNNAIVVREEIGNQYVYFVNNGKGNPHEPAPNSDYDEFLVIDIDDLLKKPLQ